MSFLDRAAERGDYLESVDEIPEPHAFAARLSLGHAGHSHDYDLTLTEDHDHGESGVLLDDGSYMDAHERAHASDIERRFGGRSVSTGQIILFGLTGGLIPCPAAITVLLLCLQLKQLALGAVLVLSFSVGLAITMVLVGVAASLSAPYPEALVGLQHLRAPRALRFGRVDAGDRAVHGCVGLDRADRRAHAAGLNRVSRCAAATARRRTGSSVRAGTGRWASDRENAFHMIDTSVEIC
ncbi:sulfite exporter TauE/SafE family protein [Sphingomonas sp. 3P27F8]|uniref:HoxN/HupN/NixA family nickel/cobalt transporter n=1 Tax=Sphingomonas sp. 3P27F8 TaxID=2502213 RepID=UPI0024B61747|nr:sulfite exporter TauE/SafE family protein [Sphingomonas sp. 3P27F8]